MGIWGVEHVDLFAWVTFERRGSGVGSAWWPVVLWICMIPLFRPQMIFLYIILSFSSRSGLVTLLLGMLLLCPCNLHTCLAHVLFIFTF